MRVMRLQRSFGMLRSVVFQSKSEQAGSHGVAVNCAVLQPKIGAPQKETVKIIKFDKLSWTI